MTRHRLDKNERKKQIKDSAMKLFTERGYRRTSVQDIVDLAEFSKGGFYNLYAGKEDLLKDILADAMRYRQAAFLQYVDKHKDMPRKELIVELLLDSILDYHPYKKMFVKLVAEMSNNPQLMLFLSALETNLTQDFMNFCQREDFSEYIKVASEEFGLIVSSLMMGSMIFGSGDNNQFRKTLRDFLAAYFERVDLFGDEAS